MSESYTKARAIAEMESFLLPLHIWRMIWEEIVPKRFYTDVMDVMDVMGREFEIKRVIHQDIHEITMGRYGFVRLMALWNILVEIHWGYYPRREMILQMISHRVGSKSGYKRARSGTDNRSAAEEALSVIVPRGAATGKEEGLGWFVVKTEEELNEKGDKQTHFICWSNEIVLRKISAVMRTAMEVGNMARSESFVVKYEEKISDILSDNTYPDDVKRNEVIFRLFNDPYEESPYGESLTMELCRAVRRCLNKYNFGDENERIDENEQKTLFIEIGSALDNSKQTMKKSVKIPEQIMQRIHGGFSQSQ